MKNSLNPKPGEVAPKRGMARIIPVEKARLNTFWSLIATNEDITAAKLCETLKWWGRGQMNSKTNLGTNSLVPDGAEIEIPPHLRRTEGTS